MPKNLLIVESPAKANTIKKYLGKDFNVLASYGHVRDLKPKGGAVDVEHDFSMQYVPIEKNAKHIAAIVKALRDADTLYLATDPDREGEAIAWHLRELLKQKKVLQKKPVYRIAFHEITKSAIQNSLEHARDISMDLVDAQQARRALDYLVGFNLSPLLWKKIHYGLSAGRVQSPALRMIVEREIEIEEFKKQEYWTILSNNLFSKVNFDAKLTVYNNKKVEQFTFTNEAEAHAVEDELSKQAQGKLQVIKVEKKQRKRNPAPPFITSTLQQEAARKLGFGARRTMQIAQQLYEGIDLGKEARVGLITYMRTDSVTLAKEAIDEIRAAIEEKYGSASLPEQPHFYKTKSKNAQEAHEAIRPTACARAPEDVARFLKPEQLKLYALIWKRTMACQMLHATIDTVAVDLKCGPTQDNIFRSNGSHIKDPGFMAVYLEDVDEEKENKDKDENVAENNADNTKDKDGTGALLPEFKEGDVVDLLAIKGEQHFTEPPPRYSEASLIKTLEEYGIGRPSTYATIIDTLLKRLYVTLENRRFRPTDMGRVVNRFLTTYFTKYVDYGFTAKLEDDLDDVARGENHYLPLLKEFWQPFKHLVDEVTVNVQRKDVRQEILEEKCPKCGKPLSLRLGKNGYFIGCTGFPDCDYTASASKDGEQQSAQEKAQATVLADRKCPQCGSPLQIKVGKYGKFIGCSNYPNCHFMEPLDKPVDTGITCPQCKKGTLVKRKSRFGTYFYSCSTYPKCKYAIPHQPLEEKCPKCGWPILMLKTTKRRGTEKVCPNKECGYSSYDGSK